MILLKRISCRTRTLVVVVISFLVLNFEPVSYDYRFESADNEVAMVLHREKGSVHLSLRFSDATKIASVNIEKSNDAVRNYSRCGYIGFEGSSEVVKIEKKDNYPLSTTSDAFYRLRINFIDGAERLYPSVRLPAISE